MFLEGITLGVIIGKLRGGRLWSIGRIKMKMWPLIIVALLIQFLSMFIGSYSWSSHIVPYAYIVSLGLILVFLIFNFHKKSLWIIFAGIFLNMLALILHKNAMPIAMDLVKNTNYGQSISEINNNNLINYISFEKIEGFSKYLGRFIFIKRPYICPSIMSIGDILVSIGVLVFTQSQMMNNYYGKYSYSSRSKMINFRYSGNK
ncbi:MAG: DUF5317 domain-containing protein [Anaeromicrobium sp.]|jgi:hypothetical protein|uniref:DUF5317 family protein n=1 Tax=Anaeromicrobium sp. TaxID=1929132 RepID=UPI0025D151BE|nr:DUF5317 family protein [Anaeromicrobium sp.]MCT4592711.1 DUF5317 domain-containing protein [Anaeromicrobium sp.]